MNVKLVSVIIPAYNVETYLEECVQSFFFQTYPNYEIIIIDDGSTDRTYEVAKRLEVENKKIKLFHQQNKGVSIARNVGMEKAEGEYYIFADADDVVAPQYIESLVSCAKKSDMGIVDFTLEKESLIATVSDDIVCGSASIAMEHIILGTKYDGYLWNKIFKKDIIEEYALVFRKDTTVWEDMLFVLEYLKKSKQIAILDEKLYYYRCREGSAVNTMGIDKFRSKYEVMAEIKAKEFAQTKYSKRKVSFLYFETMFSYLNRLLAQENVQSELSNILSRVKMIELLKQKDIKLILKFFYLKVKVNECILKK